MPWEVFNSPWPPVAVYHLSQGLASWSQSRPAMSKDILVWFPQYLSPQSPHTLPTDFPYCRIPILVSLLSSCVSSCLMFVSPIKQWVPWGQRQSRQRNKEGQKLWGHWQLLRKVQLLNYFCGGNCEEASNKANEVNWRRKIGKILIGRVDLCPQCNRKAFKV